MKDRLPEIAAFLIDIERLKLIERKAYVSDLSRRENSAEHSWHLAVGLLTIAHELQLKIDLHKALVMALVHDICEVDAGDTPVYGQERPDQHEAELKCLERLESHGVTFGVCVRELWLEYEAQTSIESRWVKVMDRLMPFLVNLATEGKNWKEQHICRSQLLASPRLIGAQPDPTTFAVHFRGNHNVTVFPSLGKDATLIAPCPRPGRDFAHLAQFMRFAEESQIQALWRQVSVTAQAVVGDRPRWLSTAGLGVAWLHVRLDTRPKYYRHVPYKQAEVF